MFTGVLSEPAVYFVVGGVKQQPVIRLRSQARFSFIDNLCKEVFSLFNLHFIAPFLAKLFVAITALMSIRCLSFVYKVLKSKSKSKQVEI